MKFGTLLRIPETGDLAAEAKTRFEALAASGFETCQLIYKPDVWKVEDAKIIRAAAEAAGIEISAQFVSWKDGHQTWDLYEAYQNAGLNSPLYGAARAEYVAAARDFVKEVGVKYAILHAGYVPNDPFSPKYAAMVSVMEKLALSYRSVGINICFETGQESPISLLRLIEDVGTGNLFVNFDTGNLILYGYGNPVDALTTFGPYVRSMHAKDGLPPTTPRKLGREVEIGAGNVDFPKVFRLLKELGFEGPITIEREISGSNADDIKRARAYIESLL